jgi:hypothetical protein
MDFQDFPTVTPKSFAFLFRLSLQQQNVIDAGYRSTSHGTSVRVRARGGSWAAYVLASLWLESPLLLQIPAADGRADGDPDDNDIPVSEKIVHGRGRPTKALEAVLSPTILYERSDVFQRLFFFFLSLSKHTGLCRAIVLV